MEYRKYDIIKNCFAGRKGYQLTLDPNSEKCAKLLSNGFIKEHGAIDGDSKKAKQNKPPASKRQKKVVKPAETK